MPVNKKRSKNLKNNRNNRNNIKRTKRRSQKKRVRKNRSQRGSGVNCLGEPNGTDCICTRSPYKPRTGKYTGKCNGTGRCHYYHTDGSGRVTPCD